MYTDIDNPDYPMISHRLFNVCAFYCTVNHEMFCRVWFQCVPSNNMVEIQ